MAPCEILILKPPLEEFSEAISISLNIFKVKLYDVLDSNFSGNPSISKYVKSELPP